jgi:hypothetical protein
MVDVGTVVSRCPGRAILGRAGVPAVDPPEPVGRVKIWTDALAGDPPSAAALFAGQSSTACWEQPASTAFQAPPGHGLDDTAIGLDLRCVECIAAGGDQ